MKFFNVPKIEKTILYLFIIIIPLISFTPLFYIYQNTPQDRIFTGVNRNSDDYYLYLAGIAQGKKGSWTVTSPVSLLSHQPTLIHEEYTLMGQLARLFNWSSPFTYHFFRFVLAILFLYIYYFFLKSTIARIMVLPAFFLSFVVGSLIPIADFWALISGKIPFTKLHVPLSWLLEVDLFRRSSLVPHYQLGSICFLLCLLFYYKSRLTPQKKYYLLTFLSGFFLTFFQPVNSLILGLTLFIDFIINLLIALLNGSQFREKIRIQFAGLLVVFISFLPFYLYYRYAFSLPFWNFVLDQKASIYNLPDSEFLLALGPVFFLGLLGFIVLAAGLSNLHKNSYLSYKTYLLLFSWLLSETLVYYFLYLPLNIERIRVFFQPFYLPLAVFAAVIPEIFSRFFALKYRQIVKIIFLLLLFIITLPSLISSYFRQIYEFTDYKSFSVFVFPTVLQNEAYQFIEKNTPANERILTLYEGTFLIPALTGNSVSLGLNYNDKIPGFSQKEITRNLFFQGNLTSNMAKKFLTENNVTYVYYGYQEKSLGGNVDKYPFLSSVFANEEVTVFQFTNNQSL